MDLSVLILSSEVVLTSTSSNKTSGAGKSFGTFLFPAGRPFSHSATAVSPSSSNLDRWTGLTLRLAVLPESPTLSRLIRSSESSFRADDALTQCLVVVSVEISSSSQTRLKDRSTSTLLCGPVMSKSVQSVAGFKLQHTYDHSHRFKGQCPSRTGFTLGQQVSP